MRFVPSRHGKVAFGRVPFIGEVLTTPRGPGRLWDYRMGGAFELSDHGAEFEFEQFEDFAGGIAVRAGGSHVGNNGYPRRLRLDIRRRRFRPPLSKQTERHGASRRERQ